VEAISSVYEVRSLPSPLLIRAHSSRGVESSKAFLSRVSFQEVCDAAGLASPLSDFIAWSCPPHRVHKFSRPMLCLRKGTSQCGAVFSSLKVSLNLIIFFDQFKEFLLKKKEKKSE